ncbi:MAG: hemolysin, partial [Sphingobacteriales bacterium]
MKIITTEEFAKATKLDKLHMPGLASLLMELMKINQVNDLFAQAQPKEGPDFVDAILEGCGVKIEFDEKELKNIPASGGFIAIANHPYGGIEGMVLLKILCTVRPEAKIMANFLLKKIPNLANYFIAVNPFENIDHSSSISGLKTTLDLVNNGNPIGIFPAGEVSTFKLEQREVT